MALTQSWENQTLKALTKKHMQKPCHCASGLCCLIPGAIGFRRRGPSQCAEVVSILALLALLQEEDAAKNEDSPAKEDAAKKAEGGKKGSAGKKARTSPSVSQAHLEAA